MTRSRVTSTSPTIFRPRRLSVHSATTWEGVQTSSGPPSEIPGVGPPPCSRKMVVAPDRPHLLVAQGVAEPPVDHGDGVAQPGSSLVANGIRGVLFLRLPRVRARRTGRAAAPLERGRSTHRTRCSKAQGIWLSRCHTSKYFQVRSGMSYVEASDLFFCEASHS